MLKKHFQQKRVELAPPSPTLAPTLLNMNNRIKQFNTQVKHWELENSHPGSMRVAGRSTTAPTTTPAAREITPSERVAWTDGRADKQGGPRFFYHASIIVFTAVYTTMKVFINEA